MAHARTARTDLVNLGFGLSGEQSLNRWSSVRTASRTANVPINLIDQASDILSKPFDPSGFLLSHATIVASVDVVEPPGVKTGSVLEDGFRVNRKYGDYRIKPTCDRYINNNLDAWARRVLLASYPTFIGAHNFVEHVQVEDLSKGRIIDAVARDIGDSVYVDILIATDRAHSDLIASIESGKMATLSMGCTVDGTICTKCGHWAADETEMCPHVKYNKGNVFFDNNGGRHRIAELCGHESISPHGGVQFIEASWVATPAFTGAVLRNVLEPSAASARRAQEILSQPPAQWDAQARQKAAFAPIIGQWGDEEEEEGGEEETAPEDPLQTVEDDLHQHVLDRVKKRIKKDLEGDEEPEPGTLEDTNTNETIVKEGASRVYRASLRVLVATSESDIRLIDRVAALNHDLGIEVPVEVYRTILKVGGVDEYPRLSSFTRACRRAIGRQLTMAEAKTLVRLGKLISRRRAAATSSLSPREENNPGHRQGD